MMRRLLAVSLAIAIAGVSCALFPQATPVATPQPPVTPVSDSPAAGICGEPLEGVVTVTIYHDIPDPRCSIVQADQFLRVVNGRSETIQVSLAWLSASIEPGGEYVFELPFGDLFEKGVHVFTVLPCCGAELWYR